MTKKPKTSPNISFYRLDLEEMIGNGKLVTDFENGHCIRSAPSINRFDGKNTMFYHAIL